MLRDFLKEPPRDRPDVQAHGLRETESAVETGDHDDDVWRWKCVGRSIADEDRCESQSRWACEHPPTLYPYWSKSLLAAVMECDPKFTSSLEAEWREVLEIGVKYIITEGDRYALAQPVA